MRKNNTWSVVEQKHIPSNNLGAVEIEGRVYFIINKFPFDSGIRIPPGELYPVHLDGMKESKQEVIELKDESISLHALKIVMDSIYTGDLHVNEENVFEVLAAADHLQVTSVVQQCCDFLKRNLSSFDLTCTTTACSVQLPTDTV
ncbi:hypothetical protein OS493_039914 [Desmophyllum pertusum]|uniref:BTB domain-containing protein n=1 Tax=Desmophyllum pertusum TaxID=174260 RepID=A0A9W9Y6K8_9CNID|nr:hypothetical protein OS493_039914 [Desmophyllum pertusum]